MRAVIQAVSSASVRVEGGAPRAIGPGLMILLGVKDSYKAGLEIVALDRNELLRDVLSALADIRVPIYTMNARQVENNCAVVSLTIGINNTEHLNRVVARLSKVKDVLKVTRS